MSYELSAMTYEILLVTLPTSLFLNSLEEAFQRSTSHTAAKCKMIMDFKKIRELWKGAVGWGGGFFKWLSHILSERKWEKPPGVAEHTSSEKKNRTRELQIRIWPADHTVAVFCDFLCSALLKSSDLLVNNFQIQMQISHGSNRNFMSDRMECKQIPNSDEHSVNNSQNTTKQCLKKKLTPAYAKIKIPNTSTVCKYTQHKNIVVFRLLFALCLCLKHTTGMSQLKVRILRLYWLVLGPQLYLNFRIQKQLPKTYKVLYSHIWNRTILFFITYIYIYIYIYI